MTTQLHNQNKPFAGATLRKDTVDKPSVNGSFIMEKRIEIWKPIKGFEKKYLISNYGRVKSLERRIGKGVGFLIKERMLSYSYDKYGYPSVSLSVGNYKNVSMKIHRLVATHFVPNKNKKMNFVCHIDDNILNNYSGNLYWGNFYTNSIDRKRNSKDAVQVEDIEVIKFLFFKEGLRQTDIAEIFNTSNHNIYRYVWGIRCAGGVGKRKKSKKQVNQIQGGLIF